MIHFHALDHSPQPAINVTPLVDVIFILLIFFLLTADATRGIVLDLPEAASGEAIPSESWEIAITADGHLLFNGVTTDTGKLSLVLQAARLRAPSMQLVVLRADRAASVDVFVDVLDTVRRTGFYNLVIATEPKSTVNETREP